MSAIGTKLGTKTFSENITRNEIEKQSNVSNISANDKGKLSDADIGNVLNKIADPNFVDKSKKVRGTGSDKMDKDAFMKLMFAQMKNQDPTNPLKSHEMAAQLAQFSQLEQLQNVNTTLTEMRGGQKPTENFQALNFIGKAVTGDSSRLTRTKGDKDHDISFNLPEDASDIKIKVRNSAGEVIRSSDMKDLKKGENKFTWNGQDDKGSVQTAGDYQIVIEATSKGGKKLPVKTDFDGVISGVSYSNEGPVLHVGNQTVKLGDVKKIMDPSLKANDQKKNNSGTGDLKMMSEVAQAKEVAETVPAAETAVIAGQQAASAKANGPKGATSGRAEVKADQGAPEKEFEVNTASMMDSVGMSRELQSKLQKETK